ncbi:MAG: phage portal protein [Methyloprofundus sp.]|nr:phage portal protein [Methyloprofundus sp.]
MSILDKLYRSVNPEKALRREMARVKLNALQSVQASGYDRHGASKRKKSLLGWISKGADADADIIENLETLRERSRDLFMGTPIATGALKTIRTNVVGSGLKLNPTIDYEYLGITEQVADQWEKDVEREWNLWAGTQDCDAARLLTFGQMQSLALLSSMINGDVFAVLPVVQRKGSIYDLRVSLVEGDRVCDPKPKPKDKDILAGVEVGDWGEPIAYHIAKYHPGTADMKKSIKNTWSRIPAFGEITGRRNVLHLIQDLERPGQRRAAPLLSPVIETLKQLGRYTDAELMAAVVSGMFTVFVKSNTPDTPLGESVPFHEQVDSDDPDSYELGNGAIVGLGEGEDVTIANPGRANTAFDGFVTSICRQVGAALELPYELLIKHFTASYSASRAALLEAWKMFRMRRTWLTQTFCQPIYEEWLSEAVAKGRIDAPGFFEDEAVRAAWCRAEWYGPTQGQLDPLKEANAARVRVEEEFSTREREAAELTGMSWEIIHPVRVKEEQKRRDGGLAENLNQATTRPGDENEDES